jgi:hypothetical protein
MSIGSFRTAIVGLAIGSVLLSLVAILHEESPVARLLAERRGAQGLGAGLAIRPRSSPVESVLSIQANASPSELSLRAPRRTVASESLAMRSSGPPTRNTGRVWDAAQSTSRPHGGAAITLGPPIEGANSIRADAFRTPASNAPTDSASLVTRTYRPTSMSAVSLERLVRPLLTARGTTVTANPESPIARVPSGSAVSRSTKPEAESSDQSDVLIVADRPDAIGRVDALCQDLDSTSPRIAIDLVVASVVPTTGRQLPFNQWRDSFGNAESGLPTVLDQIRRVGNTASRASSQLQTTSGTWTELQWSEQDIAAANTAVPSDDATAVGGSGEPSTTHSKPNAAALTSLRIRPTAQPDGSIRIEVHAQSSHVETHGHPASPQLVTVRFNTQVVLREGATGVVNLFVDEAIDSGLAAPGSIKSRVSAATGTGGSPNLAAKIVPQPGQREQMLLLLMPRIARPTHGTGRIAGSSSRNPA